MRTLNEVCVVVPWGRGISHPGSLAVVEKETMLSEVLSKMTVVCSKITILCSKMTDFLCSKMTDFSVFQNDRFSVFQNDRSTLGENHGENNGGKLETLGF